MYCIKMYRYYIVCIVLYVLYKDVPVLYSLYCVVCQSNENLILRLEVLERDLQILHLVSYHPADLVSVLWIRIRIGSVFRSFGDPDPYSEYLSGSDPHI